jgi:hypothetical protein
MMFRNGHPSSQPPEFFVVLTNNSAQPQAFWEYWNSWGDQTISFEITTADGKVYKVSKRSQDFTRNFPSTFLVNPGEKAVFPISFGNEWDTSPILPTEYEMPIILRAIYDVPPLDRRLLPVDFKEEVWTGRIESHSYTLTLNQW